MTDKSGTPRCDELMDIHLQMEYSSKPSTANGRATDWRILANKVETELTKALSDLAESNRLLRIAEAKNRGTLANNLCPDHRDKQVGKPCLACEIERLKPYVSHQEDCPWSVNYFGKPCNCGLAELPK